jgi:hypothetical protein
MPLLNLRRAAAPTADLIEWQLEHSQPYGQVWMAAVMGCDWALYEPGAVGYAGGGVDPLRRATPGWVLYNSVGRGRLRMRRERRRLTPWVEAASGGTVVDCVDGLSWYGERYDWSRRVIYLRIAYNVAYPMRGEVGL